MYATEPMAESTVDEPVPGGRQRGAVPDPRASADADRAAADRAQERAVFPGSAKGLGARRISSGTRPWCWTRGRSRACRRSISRSSHDGCASSSWFRSGCRTAMMPGARWRSMPGWRCCPRAGPRSWPRPSPRRSPERTLRRNATIVVDEPVRAGQQIYAEGGDLIALAPVSPGGEVLADGHIHVYSHLRGRAHAGVAGDLSARIFCHSRGPAGLDRRHLRGQRGDRCALPQQAGADPLRERGPRDGTPARTQPVELGLEEKTIGNDHRGDLGQGRRRQDHDGGRVRHRPRPRARRRPSSTSTSACAIST